jgi:hypothetical protein
MTPSAPGKKPVFGFEVLCSGLRLRRDEAPVVVAVPLVLPVQVVRH